MSISRTPGWLLPLAVGAFALAGCTSEETPVATPDKADTPLFVPDGASSGARLWLEVSDSDGSVVASLWASELGPIFGWAAHATFDPQVFEAHATHLDEAVLGGDAAAHLLAARPGDVTFGAVRRGVVRGEISIDEPTQLGSFEIDGGGGSRLELRQVVVRRADGSYVPVATAGGELDTRGGAS